MTNSTAMFSIQSPRGRIACTYLRGEVDSSEITPGDLFRVDAPYGCPASTMAHDMVNWMRLREILREEWTRTHEEIPVRLPELEQSRGVFLLAHEWGHTGVPARILLLGGSPEPQVQVKCRDIIADLRSAGREALAEDLAEMINDMEEDTDEPAVKVDSLRALTRFLTKHIAFEDPIVGPDPMGAVIAEWHIDGNGLLVMAFLDNNLIHCVVQADATSQSEGLNISVHRTERQIVEEFGKLVPLR